MCEMEKIPNDGHRFGGDGPLVPERRDDSWKEEARVRRMQEEYSTYAIVDDEGRQVLMRTRNAADALELLATKETRGRDIEELLGLVYPAAVRLCAGQPFVVADWVTAIARRQGWTVIRIGRIHA
jgi:hypothetical protein